MLRRHPQLRRKGGLRGSRTIPSYQDKMNRLQTINMEKGYNMLLSIREQTGGAQESKTREMPDLPTPPIKTNRPKTPPPRTDVEKFKRKRVKKSYAGTGKDITTHKENKTELQLKKDEEEAELSMVDEKLLQEEMRPLRSGEALFNKLVKKTKKKSIPKSVRMRVKKLKEIKQANPPSSIMDAIVDM